MEPVPPHAPTHILAWYFGVWLALVGLAALRVLIPMWRSTVLPGVVVHLRERQRNGQRVYSPIVEYVDIAGQRKRIETSAFASWQRWNVDDVVQVAITPAGRVDLHWPGVVYGVLGFMISLGIVLLITSLNVPPNANPRNPEIEATPNPHARQ